MSIEDVKRDLKQARYDLKIAKSRMAMTIAEDEIMSLEYELAFLEGSDG